MRRRLIRFLRFGLPMALVVLTVLVLGCKEQAGEATTAPSGETALTVTKDTQTKTFTMAELKKLKAADGYGGIMNSVGTITAPSKVKGVSVADLLNQVGGVKETDSVKVEAKDGYTMTFSYAQIANGEFTTLDAATGKEVARGTTVPLVIYEADGKPLADDLGPLRLGVAAGQDKVTEGHWWVKWVIKLSVIPTQQPWSLKLTGKLTEDVVSTTFQSCAAPNCHGATWKDDQSREWQGVPLFLVVGRVDDDNAHKTGAFNVDLATKGYSVVVTATDGFKQTFASADVKNNKDMIVAYQRDGQAVPENQWPLRLVGSTLSKQQMVGKVASISLDFAGAPSTTTAPAKTTVPATTTTAPAGPTVLTVVVGGKTTGYSVADLQRFAPVSGYGGTKNKTGVVTGPYPCEGVPLTALLSAAGGAAGGLSAGQSVKVTAADGYTKTLTYDQVTTGSFATYDNTGAAKTPSRSPILSIVYSASGAPLDATTGPVELGIICSDSLVSDGSSWVKMLQKIEVMAAP